MGIFHKNDQKGANAGLPAHSYVPDGHGETDEQIRADVHECLLERSSARLLSISVENGIVALGGEVATEYETQRLIAIVAAIPSVRGVENRLRVSPRSQQSQKA